MSQKVPLGGFKLVEEISWFNEDLIKSYNEDILDIFFMLMFNI